MKINPAYLFITASFVALVILLVIQVNWILKSAQIKEGLFNEKANMVLLRTSQALNSDKATCRKIGESLEMNSSSELPAKLGNNEVRIIDSLFNHYMKLYNFHIDYSFEVIKPGPYVAGYGSGFVNNTYNDRLDKQLSTNGFELKLLFPEKKQFIIAEMGPMFITSVILIVVILIMFWRTILSFVKEQKISEYTNDFLNNMTHEFKTPLTNIALAGKMIIKESPVKEDKINHYLKIILQENEKLKHQVEQVLSLTALERGEIPLQKTKLDIHELIRDAIHRLSIQIENIHGNIRLNLEAPNQLVSGDRIHLSNALCNLIDNAIKYSGEKPELSIQTMNSGESILVQVSDNGLGIAKEYHKKVFDKYFRVPTGDVHDVKGFGLGLSYIKKIIELHGGRIELESEKGKGSTFTITMPNA